MKPSLRAKLERTLVRLEELNGLLAAENATRDMAQFKSLSREYAEASALAATYARYRQAEADAHRRVLGLHGAKETGAWLKAVGYSLDDFVAIGLHVGDRIETIAGSPAAPPRTGPTRPTACLAR